MNNRELTNIVYISLLIENSLLVSSLTALRAGRGRRPRSRAVGATPSPASLLQTIQRVLSIYICLYLSINRELHFIFK